MQVSVIIPVYNAAEFVTQAVESALQQPETAEVLLIEDGSSDNSLEICQKLADQHKRVKLLRHQGGENRGAGASRNLGMQNASCDYIAFLDADDFYLPERFITPSEIFKHTKLCDGVYETIGNIVYNEDGVKRWLNANRKPDTLTGISSLLKPEELAPALISGGYGSLHLDGLVIKKSALEKSGLMSEALRLHQDTEFIIRVAVVAKLLPGRLDHPVALRGIHDHNRLSAPRSKAHEYKNHMAYWIGLYHWAKEHASQAIQNEILKGIVQYTKSQIFYSKFPRQHFSTRLIWITRLLRLLKYPEVIFNIIKNRRS